MDTVVRLFDIKNTAAGDQHWADLIVVGTSYQETYEFLQDALEEHFKDKPISVWEMDNQCVKIDIVEDGNLGSYRDKPCDVVWDPPNFTAHVRKDYIGYDLLIVEEPPTSTVTTMISAFGWLGSIYQEWEVDGRRLFSQTRGSAIWIFNSDGDELTEGPDHDAVMYALNHPDLYWGR